MPVSDQWKSREKRDGGQADMSSKARHGADSAQTDGRESSTAEGAGPLSPGRTKGLAGFWANQNDEVKVLRKKRLEAVDTPLTETVVENVPQRLDGVARAEDAEEWKKRDEGEARRTRNVAFQQQQTTSVSQTEGRHDDTTDSVNVIRRATDSGLSKKQAQSPDVVLNR